MFVHTFRFAAAASLACVALAAPTTALAATEPALTTRVLSVKEFPGWQVVEKPTVSPRTTTASACESPDPVGSTTVSTTLLASTRLSATRNRSTTITETVIETPSTALTRSLYLKTRALAATCGLMPSGSGPRLRFSVGPGSVVAGASHAFAVTVSAPTTSKKVAGKTVTTTVAGRITIYLAGRYLVAITPGRATSTIQGSHVTVVTANDAYTEALSTKAATAAVALLG